MKPLFALLVRKIFLPVTFVMLATIVLPPGFAQAQTGATEGGNTLAPFWAFGMAPRTLTLLDRQGRTSMIVTYVSPDPNSLDLVFKHSQRENLYSGGFNAGLQRYCDNDHDPYLFLDGYAAISANGSIHGQRTVYSTKLILTPLGGKPIDLIADGTYARCGSFGQPYLRWNLNMPSYRLQAWGNVNGHPKQQWYWDAIVEGPVTLDDPCHFQPKLTAIKVQEAWWSNFHGKGHWTWGNGAIGPDGAPSGKNITYGRTDWHAKGHMPWYMVTSDKTRMCTGSVKEGTGLSIQQLLKLKQPSEKPLN